MARVEGLAKASGSQVYTGDIRLPGLLHAAVVRSPFPHARIREIDTSAARATPGVAVVLTGRDVPETALFGRQVRDTPVFARDEVRYVGEPVAAVAAETRECAERAARLVRVEYDPLPAVFDAADALEPDAPAVHEAAWDYPGSAVKADGPRNLQSHCVWTGGNDVDAALAKAAETVDLEFETPFAHQGYIETQISVASAEADGRVRIWAANKNPYKLRSQLADGLGIDESLIEIEPTPVGGDFGGKGSPMDVPMCIALSRAAGRPVRYARRYTEDLMAANPRHAGRIRVRLGCDAEGHLVAMDMRCLFNGGAYAGYKPMPTVNLHGPHDAGSAYRIPAIRIDSTIAYTHSVPGGHRRSPGAPQVVFALESALDELGRRVGVEPFAMRERNLLRDGDATPLGRRWVEARGVQTLAAAWEALKPLAAPEGSRHGIGIAVYDRATPVGRSSMGLRREPDGGVTVFVPQPETGNGSHTLVRAIVARGLGLAPERVTVRHASTTELPYDDGVGGSRVTATASETARQAVDRFLAAEPPVGETFISVYDPDRSRQVTSYGALIAQVAVDPETGRIEVQELVMACDVADILNPESHRVQIEGGAAMGYGYAVLEDLHVEEGRVTAANLGDYKLPSQRDMPPVRIVLVPGGRGLGPENVKAIAELSNVPVAAAIGNAIADAVGVRMRHLPLSAEQLWNELQQAQAPSPR